MQALKSLTYGGQITIPYQLLKKPNIHFYSPLTSTAVSSKTNLACVHHSGERASAMYIFQRSQYVKASGVIPPYNQYTCTINT